MVISVKYALDAQNNVGIFSADLKPGDTVIVFREEKDGQHYQVALTNENGILYVRIVDPTREARGEAIKVRKQAHANEVFSVGAATVMIMSIGTPGDQAQPPVSSVPTQAQPQIPTQSAPISNPQQIPIPAAPPIPQVVQQFIPPIPQAPPIPQPIPQATPAQSAIPNQQNFPEEAAVPFAVQIGPDDTGVFHPDHTPTLDPSGKQKPAMMEIKRVSQPIPQQPEPQPQVTVQAQSPVPKPSEKKPATKAAPLVSSNVDENTFARKMFENMEDVNPSDLPTVEGARLNYDFQFPEGEKREQKSDEPLEPQTNSNIVIPRKEERADLRHRAEIKPRSREQLFREDVRDRRFYLKGAKYSIRNKISALVLTLGVLGIGIYSVGVSHIAEKAQRMVYSDAVNAQVNLRGSEFRNRLKNYNLVLNSLIQMTSLEKLDAPTIAKGFVSFDFMVGVGVFKFVPASEGDKPVSVPLPIAKVSPQNRTRSPANIYVVPDAPKAEPTKLRKLDDGNYLDPLVQWVKESEAAALQLDYTTVKEDQFKRVIEVLKNSGGPSIFDLRELTLPNADKGVFTYVVRTQPISPIFLVIQTSARFVSDIFVPAHDIEFYLLSNKNQILYPENSAKNQDLLGDLVNSTSNSRIPSSENNYTASIPITQSWDFVGRPSSYKTSISKSDPKTYLVYGAIILMIFLIVGVKFAKNISEPLHTLVQQIETVAAGDYHRKYDIHSNDEIGQVADYFEHLTVTIKKKEQEIARVTDLASKDSLTGLYNHRHFRSQLESKWREIESGKGGSIILVDIDDFRMFNIAHGHIQGDLILKEVSQAVKEASKAASMVARYGGEEVVVWVPGADQKVGFDVAEKILKKIRALKCVNLTGGNPLTVTCSLGVTTYTKSRHINIDQFLKDADSNVIMAKKAGKNRIWAGSL